MGDLILKCRDERRRQAVRDQANAKCGLNGIDYVEVIEGSGQLELCVHFFGGVPLDLSEKNVRIHGGLRIRDIKVLHVKPHLSGDPDREDCLRVTIDKAGDFSCYKLCLYELDEKTKNAALDKPKKGFDPRYVCAEFNFNTDCPGDLDCREEERCPPLVHQEPQINYLARDFGSFRQLLLDRLAQIMPEWHERHIPDIGIALVEILAYVGDHLSYYQDAVATEAYLDTARKRISVRRHAQLVDYRMHEGCNARAWITVQTNLDTVITKTDDVYFITACDELTDLGQKTLNKQQLEDLFVPAGAYEVFEPLAEYKCGPLKLFISHNQIRFYTWHNSECCLPRGATSATLLGKLAGKDNGHPAPPDDPKQTGYSDSPPQSYEQKGDLYEEDNNEKPLEEKPDVPALHLEPGDVLIFEEVLGAKTGAASDADHKRRCAVRLTGIAAGVDPLTGTDVVEIRWAETDALKFELCISSYLEAECRLQEDISVARGNVVLVDHGRTVCPEDCGEVQISETIRSCSCRNSELEFIDMPEKFSAQLSGHPLTYAQPFSLDTPASRCLANRDPREALPAVVMWGRPANENASFQT